MKKKLVILIVIVFALLGFVGCEGCESNPIVGIKMDDGAIPLVLSSMRNGMRANGTYTLSMRTEPFLAEL